MAIQKVFIIGAGLMGAGIAQACAKSKISGLSYRYQPRELGRKTGCGWYEYHPDGSRPNRNHKEK